MTRPRYHARDVALLIGAKIGAKVLLASATPSISSYYKYRVIKLDRAYIETKKRYHFVDGSNLSSDIVDTIRENFDANYDEKKQNNDYDVIITTDTLSEGVNMHRSNIIYNYDIPWNATRLMQRIGRINRIGTKHKKIYVNNFIPSAQSDALIELSKKAFVKLQTFHSTLGEDNKIYSKDEEVGTVTLFEESTEDIDEELTFLEEIREFKRAKPKQFKLLTALPVKIRVQRKDDIIQDASFVFIKNDQAKSYYFVNDERCEPVTFVKMAKHLKVFRE